MRTSFGLCLLSVLALATSFAMPSYAAPSSGIDTSGSKTLPLSVLGVEGCELDANGASSPNMTCYGNVGVGPFGAANPPAFPLEVYTSNPVPAELISTTSARADLQILNAGGATYSGAIDLGDTAGHIWELGSDLSVNKTDSFYIYDGIARLTRFYIDPSGNVGIGTTTPQATLDVTGNINTSGNVTAGGTLKPGSFTVGQGCSPEGVFGYDAAAHEPIYCDSAGTWASMAGTSLTGGGSVIASPNACNGSASNTVSGYNVCFLSMTEASNGGHLYDFSCNVTYMGGTTWKITSSVSGSGGTCSGLCYMTCY